MALQPINIGTAPNDKTGDSLRVGGQKINDNFASLAAVASSGSASDLATGTLPAARLPNPSTTTLGGVQALAAVSHKWLNAISTTGVPSATQPALADISDGSPMLGITRAQIASYSLATYSRFLTIDGAPWIKGSGPYTITDAGGQAWQLDLASTAANLRWFGAVGDGSTDDAAAVRAWLTYLCTYGGKGFAPAGNYAMATGVSIPLNASISVECAGGARFTALSGFPHTRFFMFAPGTGDQTLNWYGGEFNGVNIPNSVDNEANDLFSVNADNCVVCDVYLEKTYCGADWLTSGGDGHLFIGAVSQIRAGIGYAYGSRDTAIYISGSSDGSEGKSLYAYGTFENCDGAVIVKRLFEVSTIDANVINCLNGVGGGTALLSTGPDAGKLALPGNGMVVRVNAWRTETACFLQGMSGALVDVNTWQMGVSIAGHTSTVATGLFVTGASSITGRVNAYDVNPACTVNSNFAGVSCARRPVDDVNHDALDNFLQVNASAIGRAFIEDANADRNTFYIKERNIIAASAVAGASSVMVRSSSSTNSLEMDAPTSCFGGAYNHEAFRVVKVANQVNFLRVTGAATGGAINLAVSSSVDTNVGMSISTRGTGVLALIPATITVANIPVYADNAAAVAGGLAANAVYRTATGEFRVRV